MRAEIQKARGPARLLASQFGVNPKTILKWRKRTDTTDAPKGPRQPKSTLLTPDQDAQIVECRRETLLPLDKLLSVLRPRIPDLSRSALHRCLKRHGISRV
jgi:transposase